MKIKTAVAKYTGLEESQVVILRVGGQVTDLLTTETSDLEKKLWNPDTTELTNNLVIVFALWKNDNTIGNQMTVVIPMQHLEV